MRLIGLDPGLRLTGWGVIDVEGNRLRHVAHGVVRVTADGHAGRAAGASCSRRRRDRRGAAPTEAAIEETFVNINPARR